MSISETEPTYNVKVVVQETGIKADTLRAWERRYGLPQPGRTAGGHRLYSRRDIQVVQWLMARLEEGMTIGLAVELWERVTEEGKDPLKVGAYDSTSLPVAIESGSALEDLREQWIASCLGFDESGAVAVLSHAFALFPVKMVCRKILLGGLAQIGELWFENKVSVQQEHFASALTMQRLDALLAAVPPPTRPGRVVLACPAGEQHTIALRTLGLLLRYQGWDAIYLGANVPAADFEVALDEVEPGLVILSAHRLPAASTLLETALYLRQMGMPTAFGGRIFNLEPSLRGRIPGHFLGESVDDAVPAVDRLLSFTPSLPEVPPLPEGDQRVLDFFRSRQALIGADTWRTLKAENKYYPYVNDTNERMAANITAALKFGQIDYMDNELAYTRRLMVNYDVPADWTEHYLNAYYQAASWHLGSDCQVIIDWLNKARQKVS